ncbi:mating type protein mtA-1 CAA75438.1 mating type protein [Pseudoneurospora amorphoporcata]|uniref:Mating type protein mtA-1 CAA75438.1 mating type protein n=1 Tax=Pseudoneurospora amorphoporcata TaxID=241081 RepID=A0AAN6SIK6_9PEZI|nr:mating type protein mtA-1 CAA75438.1 mating type protein [Pseudoneurospora amorphoporcata]
MSGVDQFVKTFANLPERDRNAAVSAILAMMRTGPGPVPQIPEPVSQTPVPKKKKVNGFMGFRSYYSPLFSQLPQKEISPFMTILWQHDPFHNEWDFMCSVYSSIRTYLEPENVPPQEQQKVTLQHWLHYAVPQMGVITRDNYLISLGWNLVPMPNGTHDLMRTALPMFKQNLQPMNGLCLFNKCLNSGLIVPNQHLVIAKLSDPSYDMIWFNKRYHRQQRHAGQAGSSELGVSALFPRNYAVAAEVDGVANLPLSHWIQQGDFGTESGYSAQFETLLDSILDNGNPISTLENGNTTSNESYNMALAMDVPMIG